MQRITELDILKIAISIEEDGVSLYRRLYKNEKNELKKQVFYAMMNEEKSHVSIFKKLYKDIEKKEEVANGKYFDSHIPTAVKTLISYFMLPTEEFYNQEQDFKEIIEQSVAQEYRTIEFYNKLKQNTHRQDIKKILYDIICEEEKHVIKLKEMIYFEKETITLEEHIHFIENVLNGMGDWVRVIDANDNIIYANKTMKEGLSLSLVGRKCYEVIGRDMPCDNCVSRQSIENYKSMRKEEEINGKIYSIMSSPLRDLNGEVHSVIEVLRDVTETKLMQEKLKEQNNKLNTDLQIAREMQYSLLPKPLTQTKVEFDYIYIPSEMIGGDFFDVFNIDESHIGVYIADVSGHGVPASMLTMFLRQTIAKDILSPALVLKQLYKNYSEVDFSKEMYITMFFGIIDINKNTIRYANAGHHMLPMLLDKDNGKIISLEATGIPISRWMDQVEYDEYVQKLKINNRLVFFTDGVTEICNSSSEMYGISRLKAFNLRNKDNTINKIKDLLTEEINAFKKGTDQITDDITAVFLDI